MGTKATFACRRGCRARPLIAREVKQLVFEDRSASAAAELVAFQSVLRGSEIVPGVEIAVPQEFEDSAVYVVSPGFGDDIDHAAPGTPVNGAKVVLLQPELVDGVRIRERQIHAQVRVVVRAAVERVVTLRRRSCR